MAQPQPQPAAQQTPADDRWSVIDLNARLATRRHDVPVALDDRGFPLQVQPYMLSSVDPVKMPKEHAMLFLRDASFIVKDQNGVRQQTVRKPHATDGYTPPEGFTIAAWDELTEEALFRRCKTYPASVNISTHSTRADMVAFLLSADRPTPGVSRGSENIIREDPVAAKMIDMSDLLRQATV